MKRILVPVCALLLLLVPAAAQQRGHIGVGYDEGLAGRYFFNDRMGVQAALSLNVLGGYDATANNNGAVNPENDYGFSAGFLLSILKTEYVYLDGLGEIAFTHDDTRNANDVGNRNWSFLRAALAPEFLLGSRVGLGLRLGVEIASMSGSKKIVNPGGVVTDTDDGVTNFRFFGPQNPFFGPLLGMSLYVYFGGS